MKVKNREFGGLRALLIGLFIVLIIGGGIFGLRRYEEHQRNKIYGQEETVSFEDFDLRLTKVEIKPVDLPIEENVVAKYGPIDNIDDCETFSDTPIPFDELQQTLIDNGGFVLPNFSEKNLCYQRKHSKEALATYLKNNRQIVIDYELSAKNNVDISKVEIKLLPDSGREVNNTEIFGNDYLWFKDYNPYFSSGLGGNINKDLSRKAYIYTDIRNDENSLDFIIKHAPGQERIIRIQLH